MDIIIHRGTKQIGGCVTEIRTGEAHIFVDAGSNLPGPDGLPVEDDLKVDGLNAGTANADAVFFTHYHGDHIGKIGEILPGIDLYMGNASKEIFGILQKHLRKGNAELLVQIKTFAAAKSLQIKDIKVTPLRVDHSAYDAYMFLIEADGKKILHTGDFRSHGWIGKGLIPTLEKYVKTVDVLITEGTMLSRDSGHTPSERDVQNDARKILQENKYLFLLCSSTNIDRIAAVHKALPRGRYFLCDTYQKEVLDAVTEDSRGHGTIYDFSFMQTYGKNLDEKMKEKGFCMLVRANPKHPFYNIIRQYISEYPDDTKLVYSMWEGYRAQEHSSVPAFLEGIGEKNLCSLHTTGHATKETIGQVIGTVQPKKGIIPIHSEYPKGIGEMEPGYPVVYLEDGEVFEVQ